MTKPDKKPESENRASETPTSETPATEIRASKIPASEIRESEEERADARPFSYPYPERRSNVRAVRHVSREEADADSVPGVPGGYGTSGGGQPSRTGSGGDEADPDRH
jgi:hypothetical protein